MSDGPGRVGVVSVGMMPFSRVLPEDTGEMVYRVTKDALEGAGLRADDVDAVVLGSAVDPFNGINESDKFAVAAATGGRGKPCFRNATSGSTAVSTPSFAYELVASGLAEIALCVCYEKMSDNENSQKVFNYVYDPAYVRPVGLNVPIQCGLEARAYLHRYGITEEEMALVSVKNLGNARANPYAQRGREITVEDVLVSQYISWPVKVFDTSPVSDGARAAIFASEGVTRELDDDPVWVRGIGRGADSYWYMGRRNKDLGRLDYAYLGAKLAYEMAGIKDPAKEVHYAEPYDPFTYKEMQHTEALGLCEEGGAGRFVREGHANRDGDLPTNASGGLLGEGNPIGAGMSRFNWCWLQIKGRAGDCQVERDVDTAACTGWGGMYQYNATVVLGRDD
jgi:acetyl-CoA C-acetyltransferase